MVFNTSSIVLLVCTTIIAVMLTIIFLTLRRKEPVLTRTSYALGTIIQLKASGNNDVKAIDEAIERLNDIDDKMSAFKNYSEVSKINSNAGALPQVISADTYSVLKKAVEFSNITGGAFDPTIRPLVKLWNIGTGQEQIPNGSAVKEKLSLVNYKDILFDEANITIKLKQQGQAIDLGGIAKGFAADEVKEVFLKHHIKSALIDLGGNIFALGSKSDGTPWRVGIQNPFKPRGQYVGILSIKNKSVVTSGNYEKYFIQDGKRFHHIIDPKTGYPSESKIISATIISDKSIAGDGLSTGVYILGIENSIRLIESIPGIDAIFVTEGKKVYVTSGIKENFNLTDSDFFIDRSCNHHE